MNLDHMGNIELLNFCDEGTDGQKKSFMILLNTLHFTAEGKAVKC